MENIYAAPKSAMRTQAIRTDADYTLFTPSAIAIATAFGSVAAGGYLVSRNLNSLGRHQSAKNVMVLSMLAAAAILIIALTVLPTVQMAIAAFILPQVVAMMQLSKKWFQNDVDQHIELGGKIESSMHAVEISLLFTAGVSIAAVLLGLLMGY